MRYQVSRKRGAEHISVKHLYCLIDRAALAVALEGASGPTFTGRRKDAAIQAGSRRLGGRGGPGYISFFKWGKIKGKKVLFYSFNTVPSRKIRIGGSRLLQIKGTRSFRVKKGGSLSSIRRAGSLKSTKLSRQDSESENEELQLSHSRDTVTDIGNLDEWVEREGTNSQDLNS